MSLATEQLEFIDILTKRILSLLPNKTGQSVAEVELNSQFVVTRNIINENRKKHPEMVSHILLSFTRCLEVINKESNYLDLKDRDEKSLASTLIICRLISYILKSHWNKDISFSTARLTDLSFRYSKFRYYDLPRKIDSEAFNNIVRVVVELLSSRDIRNIFKLIRTPGYIVAPQVQHEIMPDQNVSGELETSNYSEQIDTNVALILQYVAAANAVDYYKFLYSKIFRCIDLKSAVPTPILQKYTQLLKFVYYSEETGKKYSYCYANILPYIKSNTWKKAFLVFATSSIQDQSFSRTLDYNVIVTQEDVEFQRECKKLYDEAASIFEDDFFGHPCYSFVSLWLLMLCLEDFIELEKEGMNVETSSKIRRGSRVAKFAVSEKKPANKRLQFLHTILTNSEECKDLESFDALVKLFHLGVRLKAEKFSDHPILKFCYKYVDSTHDNLMKFGANYANFSDEMANIYDNVKVNFYTAALLLKPQYYIDKFIQNFESCKDNVKDVRSLVKIIKYLSELDIGSDVFMLMMSKISYTLKSMIYGSVKILSHHESITNSHNFPHSCDESAVTELLSVDSFQFDQHGNSSEILDLQKTSLDHYVSEMNSIYRPEGSDSSHHSYQTQTHHSHSSHHHHHHSHSFVHNAKAIVSPDKERSNSSSTASVTSTALQFRNLCQLVRDTEEMLSDLFKIFTSAPQLYFNDAELMKESNFESMEHDELIRQVVRFSEETSMPIRFVFKSTSTLKTSHELFDSACSLSMVFVDKNSEIAKSYTTLSTFSNYVVSNIIIQSICEACLSFSMANSKFKSCFILVNSFLQCRSAFQSIIDNNRLLSNPDSKEYIDFGANANHAIEKVLLLSLCTHDIEFYNLAKTTMKWYCDECKKRKEFYRLDDGYKEDLSSTLENFVNDDHVFTGFVSLQKRFRGVLRHAKPTRSLYHVWLLTNHRWLEMLESKTKLNDENLLFRHFTGFLVSTSGCFLREDFSNYDPDQKARAATLVSEFFDKCLHMLTSSDLVIRVVIKDALSNECHSSVYQMLAAKFTSTAIFYTEKRQVNSESISYFEQVCVIMTSMLSIKNDADFVLAAALPEICSLFMTFIGLVDSTVDTLRLKLRFCKLLEAFAQDKEKTGISGAFKLRNSYAKALCEWLEQSVFYEPEPEPKESESTKSIDPADPKAAPKPKNGESSESIETGSSKSGDSKAKSEKHRQNKEQEIAFLNVDLAAQSSKTLLLLLDEIYLEVPDGIKDEEVRKYKDLSFGNYFSLFYKVIQKYTNMDLAKSKSKYKLNNLLDNVLKCISNILQYDIEIGMQFVLPLGYHENVKIRSIFLNVFSNMLESREQKMDCEEFTEKTIQEIGNLGDVYGAIAEVASSNEYNLLASSLFGIFSYVGKLDQLFKVLIRYEISNVTRATDIFRRNSTLTRLLSNFATNHGKEYLTQVLQPFIEEIVEDGVTIEVEKTDSSCDDTKVYMKYFSKLVDLIVSSVDLIPPSFKVICAEIYKCVKLKFEDASLTAVGSFIFLRFLCPSIISPESFFSIAPIKPKVKRTLMQLVKVIQNMANGSLGLLKWPGLVAKMDDLNALNLKIRAFLKSVATEEITEYPFAITTVQPIAELRYLHKFIYYFHSEIKVVCLGSNSLNLIECVYHQGQDCQPRCGGQSTDFKRDVLQYRIAKLKSFDKISKRIGLPKQSVQLQIRTPFKSANENSNAFNIAQFNDFMGKMSMKYLEKVNGKPLVHSSIYLDGTPMVVMNLKRLKNYDDDVTLMAFKLFETASQVWDNKYYLIYDLTEFRFASELANLFSEVVQKYAPEMMYVNCERIYYFNIPRIGLDSICNTIKILRSTSFFKGAKLYCYSQVDSRDIVNNLCLDPSTVAIGKDTRVVFNNVTQYDPKTDSYDKVSLRIGRNWIQVCAQSPGNMDTPDFVTKEFIPIDIYSVADISKCEISHITGTERDEFTIFLNDNQQVILKSKERQEILRFLYFTTSRLSRDSRDGVAGEEPYEHDERRHYMHWFGRLYNIVFQGLLSNDDQVKGSAAMLFGSLSSYFNIDFGITASRSKFIQFPSNSMDFVHQVSKYLSQNYPMMTYRFFKAYFDNYDKISEDNKLSSIIYISPWVNNIYSYVYLEERKGIDKTFDIIRQLCRITAANKQNTCIINDYIWKSLFRETRLLTTLIDEVVSFSIDSQNDTSIINIISPSIEVCGEIIARLLKCVSTLNRERDSAIALQSKVFEIRILVKISISLFFNSYELSKLYLGDIFFLISLFIDNNLFDAIEEESSEMAPAPASTVKSRGNSATKNSSGEPQSQSPLNELGNDLQKLCINMIHSFLHKPDLTPQEHTLIDKTIRYFSDQRAKMLFGLTRELLTSTVGPFQIYNKIMNFEILCDYLNDFMVNMGATDNDKYAWRIRWCSNSINTAITPNNLFQGRAILIVGILSKYGINDSVACRFIKLTSKGQHNDLEFVTNVTFAIARILQGLPANSTLLSTMMWTILCFGLINNSIMYQPAVLSLINTVTKLDQHSPDFIDTIFDQRLLLEPLLTNFELTHGLKITKQNFDLHIFFILIQGLRVSQFRHSCVCHLKKYFEVKRKNLPDQFKIKRSVEKPGEETDPNKKGLALDPRTLEKFKNTPLLSTSTDDEVRTTKSQSFNHEDQRPANNDYLMTDPTNFLVFIYLSVDDNTFTDYLKEVCVDSTYIDVDNGHSFPQLIISYLTLESVSSKITFIQAAYFFASESIDQTFTSKFLKLYDYLFRTDREISRLVYHIVKSALNDRLINNIDLEVIDTISFIQVSANNGSYCLEHYRLLADRILDENNASMIRDVKKMNISTPVGENSDKIKLGEDIRSLQVMGYRSACLYVEGASLED